MSALQLHDEERDYLRDVEDHVLRVQERADSFRELLNNILNVNLTLETKALSEAANATNDEVKKISAWAAILFAPALIGTICGMNFRPYARGPLAAGLSVRGRADDRGVP